MIGSLTEKAKEMLLEGLITDGCIHFNSIRICSRDGELIVEYCLNGRALMWMSTLKPNFDAGDTITFYGIEGTSVIRLD